MWRPRDEASRLAMAGALGLGLAAAVGAAMVERAGAQTAQAQTVQAQPTQPTPVAARAITATTPQVNDGLPLPGFEIPPGTTALAIADPQNDVLSPEGVAWGVFGQSITANDTVENLEALFAAAKDTGLPVSVSPHCYSPTTTAGRSRARSRP